MRSHFSAFGLLISLFWFLISLTQASFAVDRFVSRQGNDGNDGLKPTSAFLTVQKGIDALNPGDRLTIGPGEYHEAVRRDGLGDASVETLIRAEIPGTVLLRGDVVVTGFEKVKGSRFVYVTHFARSMKAEGVNEVDTLTALDGKPNFAELDYQPAAFFQDRKANRLYLCASDMEPPGSHHYTVSVLPHHGFYLSGATRVTIDGIAVTGFNASRDVLDRSDDHKGVWGIVLRDSKSCIIRDCKVYLNSHGIQVSSRADQIKTSGDNIVERCVSWANASQFGIDDPGGITLYSPRRDLVRDSVAYLNKPYGINIYQGAASGADEKCKSILSNNLSWGNYCDYKIKTGKEYVHTVERSVGPGLWSVMNTEHSILGKGEKGNAKENIVLSGVEGLDLWAEFADPENHDYRLQASSRFRRAASNGRDLGPLPYEANIYYLKSDGDDNSDGLSMATAWRTLRRASKSIYGGDTLYLAPGVYWADLGFVTKGGENKPILIRGRGHEHPVIRGNLFIEDSNGLAFERICFDGKVDLNRGRQIRFDNCQFIGTGAPVRIAATSGLRFVHCEFTGFNEAALELKDCSGVYLGGNIFDNREGYAVRLIGKSGLEYSNYNSYTNAATAWEKNGNVLKLAEVQKAHDQESLQIRADFAIRNGSMVLANRGDFKGRGPLGKSFGFHTTTISSSELRLVSSPSVRSVSATTANLEWVTSDAATSELAWGETPDCENHTSFTSNNVASFSLTGLKPGTRYYFILRAINVPVSRRDILLEKSSEVNPVRLKDNRVSFTTAKKETEPATFFVSPEGDNGNTGRSRGSAWRTIQHAADRVGVGDLILIASGTYSETVRIRATGEKNAPITFQAIPGERVVIDGANLALAQGFVVGGKSHLRFDGFYFNNLSYGSDRGALALQMAGDFNLYQGRDIKITRCFSGDRGGYRAPFITAWEVEDLLVKNCVIANKMTYAIGVVRCPNFRIENSVNARPMISALFLNNRPDQKIILRNNIFTDMLKKKADVNIPLIPVESKESVQLLNNCFFLRSLPTGERYVFSLVDHATTTATSLTVTEFDRNFADTKSLFVDPAFAGVQTLSKGPKTPNDFSVDQLMSSTKELDFSDFFTTDPEAVKRGIGLQPEAFKDFRFAR